MDSPKRISLASVSFLMIIGLVSAISAYEGDGVVEQGESRDEELRKAAQTPMADLISFPIRLERYSSLLRIDSFLVRPNLAAGRSNQSNNTQRKMKTAQRIVSCFFMLSFFIAAPSAWAQPAEAKGTVGAPRSGDAELAQELSNPLANLVTIPIQMNYDRGIGPLDDGWKLQTNVQPVIPFHLNPEWNLITRTIIPVIYQDDIFPGAGSQFGLGDINLSLFLSPKKPTFGGLIRGIGPVVLFPTATDSLLGAKKWGAGPAAVALTMRGPWTVGLLANHIWSYAGDSDRQDISSTFLQPFAAYTWPSAWTVSV